MSSLSETFIFTELRGEDVSSTTKMLAAAGDSWTADIR
jgi:hypothetical protein